MLRAAPATTVAARSANPLHAAHQTLVEAGHGLDRLANVGEVLRVATGATPAGALARVGAAVAGEQLLGNLAHRNDADVERVESHAVLGIDAAAHAVLEHGAEHAAVGGHGLFATGLQILGKVAPALLTGAGVVGMVRAIGDGGSPWAIANSRAGRGSALQAASGALLLAPEPLTKVAAVATSLGGIANEFGLFDSLDGLPDTSPRAMLDARTTERIGRLSMDQLQPSHVGAGAAAWLASEGRR